MATYKNAINWIAANDGAGDTPADFPWEQAIRSVEGLVTVGLVADVFGVEQRVVAEDVLRARGFRKPRTAGANADKDGHEL
jgi:hypothetical protein